MPPMFRCEIPLLVAVSLFALCLVGLFTAFPPPIKEGPPWRKTLVGTVFTLVCVLGMTAVFFPARCSRAIHPSTTDDYVKTSNDRSLGTNVEGPGVSRLMGIRLVHGHHPPCSRFAAHEFHLCGKTFCTGCMGLLTGALAVLIGAVLYFFAGWPVDPSTYPLLVAPGVLGVLLAVLQFPAVNVQHTAVRFLINALFVTSTFFILVGLDLLLCSLHLDLLVVSFSVLWLYTRISLSNWDHERICSSCRISCGFRVLGR